MMKKSLLIFSLMLLGSSLLLAQKNEIGLFLGGSNYMGDIGRTNYIYPNSMAFGGIYKYNIHHRIAIRATYTYSSIKGDDTKSGNSYRKYRELSFSNTLHELAAGIEFNFFDYNLDWVDHTSTPYIILEAAINNYAVITNAALSDDGTEINFNTTRSTNFTIPFGIGFKGRLFNSIGYAIETSFRYTFKDDLDGYPFTYTRPNPDLPDGPPIEIIEGNSNGNDWYVFTGVTLIWAFDKDSRSWERLWERNK